MTDTYDPEEFRASSLLGFNRVTNGKTNGSFIRLLTDFLSNWLSYGGHDKCLVVTVDPVSLFSTNDIYLCTLVKSIKPFHKVTQHTWRFNLFLCSSLRDALSLRG